MAYLVLYIVLFLTHVMYLSFCDGRTRVRYETKPSFLGFVKKETLTIGAVGCSLACSNEQELCIAVRFNVASKQCQLLGYDIKQMNTTLLSTGDWKIFVKVLKVMYSNKGIPFTHFSHAVLNFMHYRRSS